MNVTVPVYQQRYGNTLQWTTLGLGPHTRAHSGRNALKVQQALVGALKQAVREMEVQDLEWLRLARGIRLERLHLELSLRRPGSKRKITGRFPVILEPRWVNPRSRILMGYHPARQEEWFPLEDEEALEASATLYFQTAWRDLGDHAIVELQTNGKDRIKAVSFSVQTPSLLDRLPDRKQSVWDDLVADPFRKAKRKPGGMKVLRQLGVDLTQRAADLSLPLGMPRSPYREQLQLLLAGQQRRPALVVGPPQSGKSTLLNCWVHDLLLAEGYEVHRNLDRVHHVWSINGQRIIAGMAYLGDWEQRCIDLLHDASSHKVYLLVEDLPAFGRLGRTRDSDRNLAEFFRGPLLRGELVMVGECTPEQLQRLEEEAPSFAALFSRVHVAATTPAETLRMLLHEARSLEQAHPVVFSPLVFRSVIEMTGSLSPSVAFPGKALDVVRTLARQGARAAKGKREELGPEELMQLLSQRTGLPEHLLRADQTLDQQALRDRFERRILGQPEAVEAACDLVMRIRAGLTDPRRPYAVYLFTGPTGTGKTELAKAVAEYLFGDPSRLVRFDIGEYGDPDAAARLAGDQYQPRGLLTEQVQQQPFCVLLLDEIEKAHPAVLNLLLQLFDEGRLTDAVGITADFTHTAVIMTSNLGARSQAPIGFAEDARAAIFETLRAVREFFPPELFNRIDRVVPFRPLTAEIARGIAAKELARLLGRRGLAERNILVHPTDRVLDRVVAEGFDPLLGARPVKRYLEEKIGSLLAERIAGGGRATMQVVRLYTDEGSGGRFRLHAEALGEAVPAVTDLPLESLLDAPVRELEGRLPAALDFLDGLLESDALAELVEQMGYHLQQHNLGEAAGRHADALYNLDALRGELRRLRGRLGYLKGKGRADRRDILRCLAETAFVQRLLDTVHDETRHAVFVELLQMGLARRRPSIRQLHGGSLLEALAGAYLGPEARGELEAYALRHTDGTLEQGTSGAPPLTRRPEQVVLKLVGLNVLDFFEGERGCHVWRSLAQGTDVLRVRVWPATAETPPGEVIEEHLRRGRLFEEALQRGAEQLPANPDGLLPLAREYGFDPPTKGGQSAPLEITDYTLGYAATLQVRALAEGLPRLWLLRMGLSTAPADGAA